MIFRLRLSGRKPVDLSLIEKLKLLTNIYLRRLYQALADAFLVTARGRERLESGPPLPPLIVNAMGAPACIEAPSPEKANHFEKVKRLMASDTLKWNDDWGQRVECTFHDRAKDGAILTTISKLIGGTCWAYRKSTPPYDIIIGINNIERNLGPYYNGSSLTEVSEDYFIEAFKELAIACDEEIYYG